jgi:hypothetical protein
VAELADALDSGSSGRKVVEVRVLSWALIFQWLRPYLSGYVSLNDLVFHYTFHARSLFYPFCPVALAFVSRMAVRLCGRAERQAYNSHIELTPAFSKSRRSLTVDAKPFFQGNSGTPDGSFIIQPSNQCYAVRNPPRR